jgi:hypothetical protein
VEDPVAWNSDDEDGTRLWWYLYAQQQPLKFEESKKLMDIRIFLGRFLLCVVNAVVAHGGLVVLGGGGTNIDPHIIIADVVVGSRHAIVSTILAVVVESEY